MNLMLSAAVVASGGYWFYAGEELGYPRWLGAILGPALFFTTYLVWPRGFWTACGIQVLLALLVGVIRTARLAARNR